MTHDLNRIEKIIKNVFYEPIFTVSREKGYETFIIKTGDVKCLDFYFSDDKIHIWNLNKCVINGPSSLLKMEILAKKFPFVKYIDLLDVSQFQVYPDDVNIQVSLRDLKILTQGKSWYNTKEYISDDYKYELECNKKIINNSMFWFNIEIYNLICKQIDIDYQCEEFTHQYYEHIKKAESLFGENLSTEMTVQTYFQKIIPLIYEDVNNKEKGIWLQNQTDYIERSQILVYNPTLKKYIDHNSNITLSQPKSNNKSERKKSKRNIFKSSTKSTISRKREAKQIASAKISQIFMEENK